MIEVRCNIPFKTTIPASIDYNGFPVTLSILNSADLDYQYAEIITN